MAGGYSCRPRRWYEAPGRRDAAGRVSSMAPVVSMVVHPFAARVVGQASRRGLIPRVPTADRLLADVEAWLTVGYPDLVRSTRRSTPAEEEARLDVSLHPAARDLVLTATDAGRVTAEADTVAVGPGYHRLIGRVLERMEDDQSISWGRVDPDRPDEPDADAVATFGDRAATERAYLGWLGRLLVDTRAARAAGGGPIHVGTPDGVRFTFEGAIATALGPRDDAWLERAVTDTRVAIDITPWWADATDGQSLLNRALCLMWFDVRWRPPALKPEGLVLDEVHRLLSRAYPLDPSLPYPWRAWAEVVGLAQHRRSDGPPGRRSRDARTPCRPRDRLPAGAGHDQPRGLGARRSRGRSPRSGPPRSGGAVAPAGRSRSRRCRRARHPVRWPAHAFIEQFAGEMGPDAIDHRAGGVIGRATLSSDASSGVEIGILEGYSAVVGSGAAIRIEFDDPADWQWAIDIWKSLAPA